MKFDQRRLSYAPTDAGNEEQAGEALQTYGPQTALSLGQILAIARAYWKASVVVTLAVIALCVVTITLLPKTYKATATLIVNSESNDPLAAAHQLPGNFVNYVVTQMELMTAPIVLGKVVDKLKLTNDHDFIEGFRGDSQTALRDYAERALAKHLDTDTGRGGQLIYVSASARYPGEAALIANAVANAYLDEERQRLEGPASERAQRYAQELSELRAKTETAQQSLTDFRQRNGLTDLDETNEHNDEVTTLSKIDEQLVAAQTEQRALEARQVGQEATANEALDSGQVDHLKTQLNSLREQQADLATTLGPKHPKRLALDAQIAATQASLDRAINGLSANTNTQLNRAIDLVALLTRAEAAQRAKLLKLRQLQDEGQKLALELESAQSVYKRALDGYDQIMFASVDHASDVSVISKATAPVRPSKPNMIKLMVLSILAAMLFGVTGPMAYELLVNRRLRCREDIERAFGIPVLAQFDAISAATVPP